MGEGCWFATVSECSYRADGQPDRMHLIPKQRLRNAGLDHAAIWDRRVWRWACRGHHLDFDDGRIRLDEGQYPANLRHYAAEHGFEWFGNPYGWLAADRG